MSGFLLRTYLNKIVHPETPSSEVPFPGALDMGCRVLERRGESLTLHMGIQFFVP